MAEEQIQPEMSKDEQIGFHKGSLATLAKEREEFSKVLNIVEQLMQMHMSELKKLGVDLSQQMEQKNGSVTKPKDKKPIEDII